MSNKKINITFSIDKDLATKFNALWDNKSFDSNEAMTIFIKKCLEIGDIPFDYSELLRIIQQEKEEKAKRKAFQKQLHGLRKFIGEKVKLFHYTFDEAFAESEAAEELKPLLKDYCDHLNYPITMSKVMYQREQFIYDIHLKTIMARRIIHFTKKSKEKAIDIVSNTAFEKRLMTKVMETDGKGIIYAYRMIFKLNTNNFYEITVPSFKKLGTIYTFTHDIHTAEKIVAKNIIKILTDMEANDKIPPFPTNNNSSPIHDANNQVVYLSIKTPNYRQDIYDMLIEGF